MPESHDERRLEHDVLGWLDSVGWDTYGGDAADRDGGPQLDARHDRAPEDVIYWDLLKQKLPELNDDLHERDVDRFCNSLRRDLDVSSLTAGNQTFHDHLRSGVQFDATRPDGTTNPTYVDLIDFENPERNSFVAANQVRVSRGQTVIPDVTLFVNGIPLVQMELKSLTADNDYYDAISDIREYEDTVPRLFVPTLLNVAADSTELRYGAVGATRDHYQPWGEVPPEYDHDSALGGTVRALANPETLLEILRGFVFYEQTGGGRQKIVPRHMQYYAVRRLLDRVRSDTADCGLVWHTQGSGKSFTMLYAARNLLDRDVLDAPQVFVIVDTDKLDDQMSGTLHDVDFGQFTVAESIDHLQELIEAGQSQLVLTTIQKFESVEPHSQGNDEVVVMSDEAHRFMEKNLGNRLDAALPDATHFGFTGTPVHEGDSELARDTFDEFSPDGEQFLHRYSIREGIDDELILPVYFKLWHDVRWDIDEAGMDRKFDASVGDLDEDRRQELIEESFTSTELGELQPRVEAYVEKLTTHFEENVAANGWKGMVVTPSREAAALYGELLRDYYDEETVGVLYTAGDDDSERVQQFHTTPEERGRLVEEFREDDIPQLLVVHNMLLTGFDAPVLKTIYLDRNLQNHTLLQAIARTNRPAEGKTNGEIVDFQGVFQNVDEALQYDEETQNFAARDDEELLEELSTEIDTLLDIFDDIEQSGSQQSLETCLARVSTHPERRQFKKGYRRVQNLYESLSPDGRLVERGIQSDYEWLSKVYVAFRRNNDREEDPKAEMREKTTRIVEEHVDVERIEDDFPVYEVGEKHLDSLDEIEQPAARASSIAHATKDHLQPRTDRNPRYERLSERVRDIVRRWNDTEMTAPEAVEALETVEREVLSVRDEREERGLSPAAYAVFAELVDEHGATVGESRAEQIARDVIDAFESDIDTTFDGWARNQTTRNEIEKLVIDVLVKEYHLTDLVKETKIVENVKRYVIENERARQDDGDDANTDAR